jgi:septin 7
LAENESILVRVLPKKAHVPAGVPVCLPPTRSTCPSQSKVPFAVVGANSIVNTPDGRQVRGRSYPWGTIEVDNEDHCDFVKLRQMLIHTHMEELREYTNDVLYENYRSEKLLAMGVAQDHTVFKEVE